MPLKADVVSQPVKACMPIKAPATLSPSDWESLVTSIYLVLFSVPHFWYTGQGMSLLKPSDSTRTSVSSAMMITALSQTLPHGPRQLPAAKISIVLPPPTLSWCS